MRQETRYENFMKRLPELLQNASAIVFDKDGILEDSEYRHDRAVREALAEAGVVIDRSFYKKNGISTEPKIFYAKAFEHVGKTMTDEVFAKIRARKKEIYAQIRDTDGPQPIHEAIHLARFLKGKGYKLAIATQVNSQSANEDVDALGLRDVFPVVVAGGDFDLPKKPDPAMYLKAAELLGIDPITAVAIEDSANGSLAVERAGYAVNLVVPNAYTTDQPFPETAIVTTFRDIREAAS